MPDTIGGAEKIMKVKNAFIVVLLSVFCMTSCNDEKFEITPFHLDKKSYE